MARAVPPTTDVIGLEGAPFLILELLNALERAGKRFEFGERGMVITGGGWKISEDKRVPYADFRKRVEEVLGIPEARCLDTYAMIEVNGTMNTCPEGHYFHIPYTWFKPLVLDKSLMPAGYGESGRFAFLDALAGGSPASSSPAIRCGCSNTAPSVTGPARSLSPR